MNDWPMFQRLDPDSRARLSNFWCRALGIVPGPHTKHFEDGETAEDRAMLHFHHRRCELLRVNGIKPE